MIPEDVDIEALARDLEKDAVAMGSVTGEQYPTLEDDLIGVVRGAADGDFGSLGYVVLDTTPAMTADLRDIAQELLNATPLETIAVRTPGSGAVVSEIHSRASLESAQHDLLVTTDYVEGASLLIRDVTETELSSMDWVQVTIWAAVALIVVLALAAISTRKRPLAA